MAKNSEYAYNCPMEEPARGRRKILLCITKSNWGGAQRHVYDLAVGLDKSRYAVTVLLGGEGPLTTKLKEAGVPTIVISELSRDLSFTKDLRVFFRLIKIFWKENPDIVHLHSSKIGALGSLSARLAGVRSVIFTGHGWAFNENRPDTAKLVLMIAYWITFLFSTKVIAVSKGLRDQVRDWPFVFHKFVIIHNGIGTIEFLPRENARKMLIPDAPPSAYWVGTIAELHHIKGLDYAIRAMAVIAQKHNALFAVIGEEGEERAKLEGLIRELDLSSRVFLLGRRENAASYLRAFDYFLLPSLSEALAYAVIEAGSAGLPTVATRVGGIPEIVDDMRSGILIWPKQPKEIVNAIDFLIGNPEKARAFGETLRGDVNSRFSVQGMITEVEKIYDEVSSRGVV